MDDSQFKELMRFMNAQDGNGDWLQAPNDGIVAMYTFQTLTDWLGDGLEETKRVTKYMGWLKTKLFMN